MAAGELRCANHADDAVTLFEEPNLFAQAVIAELFAVVGGNHDDGVFPFASLAQCSKDTTKMRVNFADHPVVLRTQVAHTRFGGRSLGFGQLHDCFVEAVTLMARHSWQVDLVGVVLVRPFASSCVRRMRSQITEVGKPRCIGRGGLACVGMPRQKLVSKKSGDAERCISFGFGLESHDVISRRVPVRAEVSKPWRIRLTEIEHPIKAGQHTGVARQPCVVGTGGGSRVDTLIGVTEQGWGIAVASRDSGHIVEAVVEWRAVETHAMVHEIHPGVQTGATW